MMIMQLRIEQSVTKSLQVMELLLTARCSSIELSKGNSFPQSGSSQNDEVSPHEQHLDSKSPSLRGSLRGIPGWIQYRDVILIS